ncbi:ABC transporter ATP-binding protein [Pontibacillus litoralis]|uniref:Glycerol-3-phosphate ABC transporter ATP-binding protein n=1 Tax=Pontibacillus litoralis JSM 072002 TaxID=1385512 RepID=A0A0A5G2G5_9BACI|nr:sn-glycerol-3-phosphate ABC transporter ATP-binding protein UgpC [Pontibacillus litoralis]KGX86234.1 glycerol-3-phosphate ABC transporter ATP-binding protein [Pontibacillus litoralis JSM 072002]
MKKVELRNVCKSYDGPPQVVTNVNVTINPGEFFILVGPSGCGKSTILRMIAGLESITGGQLLIGDQVANSLMPSERNLSMVFQNYALYPHLTVKDNIVFGLHVKKVPKEERKRRCEEVAAMLGLSDYLNRKPRHLSGGQRQRVALARAIVNESPVCLMDEPLSNLDAKLRAHMRAEIRQIQRKLGITMIYVTHDQMEAMTMGDRIMVLNKGEVQQVGHPLDIYNHPANPFVATFIGSPPMNVVDATVAHNQIHIEGIKPIDIMDSQLANKEIIQVGIRPEHISFASKEIEDKRRNIVEVVNVEVLGNETVIAFKLGAGEWMAKWSGQWRVQIGDRIPLEISYDAISVFDKESNELIKSPKVSDLHVFEHEVI